MITDAPKLTEGWISLLNSRKFHYARHGVTLCRKFMYLGSTFSKDTGKDSQDDCAECRRKLRAPPTTKGQPCPPN